ncbi:MAG: hypothetical protein V2A34_01850, partial [Lentisphaerota bacterium]
FRSSRVALDTDWTGEPPPEGFGCVRAEGSSLGQWSIEYTQQCSTVASLDTPGQAWNIDVQGSYAYIADAYAGVRIVNIGDPLHPVEAASIPMTQYARDVKVAGSYAYVASAPFKIYNIADPAHPVEVGSTNIGSAFAVEVSGLYAYVVRRDRQSAMTIVDISDPSHPVQRGTAEIGSIDCHVRVSNNYAYIALQDSGFHVVDVSDKDHPQVLSTNRMTYAMGVDLAGHYAFVGGYGALQVFDIANPAMPVPAGSLSYDGYTRDVRIVGDAAYVTGDHALRIVDISSPTNPVLSGYSETFASYTYGVEAVGSLAYVAEYEGGLKIVDLSTLGEGAADLEAYADGFLRFWVKSPVDLMVSLSAGGMTPEVQISQFNWSGENTWQEMVIPLRSMGLRAAHLRHTFRVFQCRPLAEAAYLVDDIQLSNQY